MSFGSARETSGPRHGPGVARVDDPTRQALQPAILRPSPKIVTLNGKRVAVTGAAGFVGTSLCRKLNEIGASLICIDTRYPLGDVGATNVETHRHKILPFNIADAQLGSHLEKYPCDFIFHLAGAAFAAASVADPAADFEANLQPTVTFLETLRKIRFRGCFVYSSSAAVYGDPSANPITEATRVAPISPYGLSKLSSENYIHLYSKLCDFQTVIARLFSLYGPGQRKQVVFDLAQKALSVSKEIEVIGQGTEIRDFMYVDDAAAALLHLASLPAGTVSTVNVCSGRAITIRALAEKITQLCRGNIRGIVFSGQRRLGDPIAWTGSTALLDGTGFRAEVDIESGLRMTIEWCRQNSTNDFL